MCVLRTRTMEKPADLTSGAFLAASAWRSTATTGL